MFISSLSLLALAASVLAAKNQTGPSKPDLTYLFTVNITTSTAVDIGTTPFGQRIFAPITGGSFSGPKLEGKFRSTILRCLRRGDKSVELD